MNNGLCVRSLHTVVLSLSLSLSLSVLMAIFPGKPGLAGFMGANDDGSGGDSWGCKSYKAPVKSSPSTNQHPTFYRPDALRRPTNSVKALSTRSNRSLF